ncbi:MAG: Gfo/Idh/MocA family protein [Armatimonadota bacterium]
MSYEPGMNRRAFLRRSVAGAGIVGASAFGGPAFGTVLGANDRINLAVIGTGNRGTYHVKQLVKMAEKGDANISLMAVCDVYEPRMKRAVDISGAKGFLDYTEVLKITDLDGVVIATPDHWHAKMTIDAMQAGKDVYVEKPMTLYWEEAKEVCAVQRRPDRVVQVGVQSASDDRYWKANEVIRSGGLGKLIWSTAGYYRNRPGGDWNYRIDPDADPKTNLDWKRWLGPAPDRPWDPERYFRFRKFWDYSGGLATDLLYHSLAHIEIALGPEFPKRVVASGGIYAHHDREVPDTFHVLIDFPSEHTVALFSTQANKTGVRELIRGEEATLSFEGPGVVVEPEEPFKDKRERLEIARQPRAGHMQNWLQCMRTREKPHMDAETGYKVQVPISLSVRAYREEKVMRFDPKKQEVVT